MDSVKIKKLVQKKSDIGDNTLYNYQNQQTTKQSNEININNK